MVADAEARLGGESTRVLSASAGFWAMRRGLRGVSRPHGGAGLSLGLLASENGSAAPARLFEDLRIGPDKSWRGTPLAISFRQGFL